MLSYPYLLIISLPLIMIGAYFYYQLVMKPKNYMKFYEKQGAKSRKIFSANPNYKPQGISDTLGPLKQYMSENYSKNLFVASPYPESAYVSLVDTDMIKDFLQNHQNYDKT